MIQPANPPIRHCGHDNISRFALSHQLISQFAPVAVLLTNQTVSRFDQHRPQSRIARRITPASLSSD
jgi:hypothetical protein